MGFANGTTEIAGFFGDGDVAASREADGEFEGVGTAGAFLDDGFLTTAGLGELPLPSGLVRLPCGTSTTDLVATVSDNEVLMGSITEGIEPMLEVELVLAVRL